MLERQIWAGGESDVTSWDLRLSQVLLYISLNQCNNWRHKLVCGRKTLPEGRLPSSPETKSRPGLQFFESVHDFHEGVVSFSQTDYNKVWNPQVANKFVLDLFPMCFPHFPCMFSTYSPQVPHEFPTWSPSIERWRWAILVNWQNEGQKHFISLHIEHRKTSLELLIGF